VLGGLPSADFAKGRRPAAGHDRLDDAVNRQIAEDLRVLGKAVVGTASGERVEAGNIAVDIARHGAGEAVLLDIRAIAEAD